MTSECFDALPDHLRQCDPLNTRLSEQFA